MSHMDVEMLRFYGAVFVMLRLMGFAMRPRSEDRSHG